MTVEPRVPVVGAAGAELVVEEGGALWVPDGLLLAAEVPAPAAVPEADVLFRLLCVKLSPLS